MHRHSASASGFTLIEVTLVLILLGILSAVAVPKYFDMQEQARIKAANQAISEAQARINAYFGQLLLEGNSCEQAVAGVNADLSQSIGHIADASDSNGKVFGEVTLKIGGDLLANGAGTLVTAYFDGKALPNGPHGSLVVAQCNGLMDPVSAMKIFESMGTTGGGGLGVVGTFVQSNSVANDLSISQAKLGVDALMASIGWTDPLGYWRLVKKNGVSTNLFWTTHDIEHITTKQRVPFIQAQQLPNGETTYTVGLVGVAPIGGKGAMLIRDANDQPFSTTYGTYGTKNGYGASTNGYYVTGSSSEGYKLSSGNQASFTSYDEAYKVYTALNTAFTKNNEMKNGANGLENTPVPLQSGS